MLDDRFGIQKDVNKQEQTRYNLSEICIVLHISRVKTNDININGEPSWTTVCVKMTKFVVDPCSTEAKILM